MSSLRSSIIRLAHANPELRPFLIPLLKEAGCEKLPEGGMRDNCEKKKEEGEKSEKSEKSEKKASILVPLAEAVKGDFVEVPYRGKIIEGKVVRVKTNGKVRRLRHPSP